MQTHRSIIVSCIALFLFLSTPLVASASATIFVNSATGNDTTGSGSAESPYKTFHKAYTEAESGNTLSLSGTFTWTDADETGDVEFLGYQIAKNLTIEGEGAGSTIIQAAINDSSGDRRVFTIKTGSTVTLEGVTIRHGRNATSYSGRDGGGILVEAGATLTVEDAHITKNYTSSSSWGGFGGGINNLGTLTVNRSTIDQNFAFSQGGGVNNAYIANGSNVAYITNSTITNNSTQATVATVGGAGIYIRSGTVYVTNSTIAYNNAPNGTGDTTGIDVVSGSTLHIKNSIVAKNKVDGNPVNASSGNFFDITNSGTLNDQGGNIFGKVSTAYSGVSFSASTWYDLYGNGAGDNVYTLHNTATTGSLHLATTLADNNTQNGTQTLAITNEASVAVNKGITGSNGPVSVPSDDQRTLTRVGTPDIGAFEYGGFSDNTAPSVALSAPAEAAVVSGYEVSLTASASDNVAVGGVSFYVQGVLQGSEVTVAPYTLLWDSTATSSGQKSVVAVARDTANNFATSTAVSITVNNTPTQSAIDASVSTSTATISWTTAKPGTSRVHYGVFSPLTTATSETNTGVSVTTSHERELSGLVPCAVYSYKVVSRSRNGNDVATSTEQSFITSGCSGETPVSTTQKGAIQALTGGSMTLGALTLSVPSSFTATSSEAVFQALALNSNTFVSNVGIPTGKTRAGGIFVLKALIDSETLLPTFSEFVTITLSYTAGDIVGIDEQTLSMHRFDGSVWHSLASVLDTGAKTVTATTTAFSDFGIFGSLLPVSSGGVGANAMLWCSGPMAPGWNSSLPDGGCGGGIASSINFVETQSAHSAQGTALTQSAENTASVPQFSFSRDLEEGMEGVDVRALQEFLNQSNFLVAEKGVGSPGEETNYFGALTRLALARFQEAHGISPARGYFGPITRAKISSMGAVDAIPLAITKTSSNTPTRDLEFGMEGNEVRILQEILIAEGFAISAGATGYFGAQTQSALASFQEAHGISPALGYFGAITRAHLTKTQ